MLENCAGSIPLQPSSHFYWSPYHANSGRMPLRRRIPRGSLEVPRICAPGSTRYPTKKCGTTCVKRAYSTLIFAQKAHPMNGLQHNSAHPHPPVFHKRAVQLCRTTKRAGLGCVPLHLCSTAEKSVWAVYMCNSAAQRKPHPKRQSPREAAAAPQVPKRLV